MNIQAINFKMPIHRANISFGYGSNAGRSGDNSNISGYRHISDISRAERDTFVCNSSKINSKQEFKARQLQGESKLVLSFANYAQQASKKKYAQAKKIYRTWQEERPHILFEDGKVKEYLVSYGSLNMYFEKDLDGSERIIKYLYDKPVDITEIAPNGRRDVYSFSDNGKLQSLIQGKQESASKREIKTTTEGEYTFAPDGSLKTYKQNHQQIKIYNRYQKLKETNESIETIMTFDVIGKRPYLKEARNGIFTPNDGIRSTQNVFRYDENGKLIEVR